MLSLLKFVLGDSNQSWYVFLSVSVCVRTRVHACVWVCVSPSGENTLTLPRHLSESPVTAVTHPRWKEREKNPDHTALCGTVHKHTGTYKDIRRRTHAHTVSYLPASWDELFWWNFAQIKNVKLTFDQACLHFHTKWRRKGKIWQKWHVSG